MSSFADLPLVLTPGEPAGVGAEIALKAWRDATSPLFFLIDDPERVDHFFSGETITLRRNLDRKVAGEYFHKLHKLGVTAELVDAGKPLCQAVLAQMGLS